jgi:hypothetical protein
MEDDAKAYSLPTESIPGLKYSDHMADLVEIKAFLESRGISTKNTRIERYIQYISEVMSQRPKNESLIFKNSLDERFKSGIDWRLYVLREVHELMWILRGLKVHIPAGLDSKLELLVIGSDFAALDSNPHGRNTQFELRIASYFCQAGWIVDLSTDADVIALHDEFAFFVECKRVGSMSQLQRRLAEGVKQLKRKMPRNYQNRIAFGSVAADVTKVAFSHNGLTWALTPEHSKDINQNKLKSIADILTRMPMFSGGHSIIRYWLQIHIPCLVTHPPATITRFSNYYIENLEAGKKTWPALKLLRDLDTVPNKRDERETPARKLIPRTMLKLPAGSTFRVVEQNILRELIETGHITGKQEGDIIAELEFNGIKHEFTLYDLQITVASTSKSDMESMAKNEIKSGLQLVLEMYMRRYPYENIKTPVLKPTTPDNQGAESL